MIAFAILLLLAIFLACGSRQVLRLAPIPPPEGIMQELAQFAFITPVEELPIRSFRIDTDELPFDGETISVVGRGTIYFRGEVYPYWIFGHRLSFTLMIDTPYGRMLVDNMWEFGHRRAARLHDEPVVWQEYQYNRIPIVDGMTEQEAQDLQYLFTIAILSHGLVGFLPGMGIVGLMFAVVSIAYAIFYRIHKKSARLQERKVLVVAVNITYFTIAILYFAIIIGRLI